MMEYEDGKPMEKGHTPKTPMGPGPHNPTVGPPDPGGERAMDELIYRGEVDPKYGGYGNPGKHRY